MAKKLLFQSWKLPFLLETWTRKSDYLILLDRKKNYSDGEMVSKIWSFFPSQYDKNLTLGSLIQISKDRVTQEAKLYYLF